MMIRAYDKSYLPDAMETLGEMLDYAVCGCHYAPGTFLSLFMTCGLASAFSDGNPKYLAGMSGTELVFETFRLSGLTLQLPKPHFSPEKSSVYWCGWILAYYQWSRGLSLSAILKSVPIADIENMYLPYHESSEEKAAEALDRMMEQQQKPTRLQTFRRLRCLSQQGLAEKSGVSLRSIQMYEQRRKDINKAQARTLAALALVLGCNVSALLEPNPGTLASGLPC